MLEPYWNMCVYALSHWWWSWWTPTADFRDCFSHYQSSPWPWGLSVIQATKPCSAHSTCGSQLLTTACGIGTWQVQTSMLRWQGLGILWEIVSSLCKTVFLSAHTQCFLLAFYQFVFWLHSSCYIFWSSVYCLCMSWSLDVFWDVSAWKIQHKYRT